MHNLSFTCQFQKQYGKTCDAILTRHANFLIDELAEFLNKTTKDCKFHGSALKTIKVYTYNVFYWHSPMKS